MISAEDDANAAVGQYKTFAVNTTGPIRLAQIAIDYCIDRVQPDDLTMTPKQCAGVAMSILCEPQFGDGSVVEAMLVGKRGETTVNARVVPLEALYSIAVPVGEDNHLLEEEQKFVQKLKDT